jgi:uncharacterized protein (DUF2147 family)
MQQFGLLLLISLISSCQLLAQDKKPGDGILGIWLNEEKDAKVEIYRSGSVYFGRLVWGKKIFEADGVTSKKDANNENKSLRNRPLKDLVILEGFRFEEGHWTDGKVYDPKNGKLYRCVMTLKGNILEIRGYIGFTWLGRTTTWSRP